MSYLFVSGRATLWFSPLFLDLDRAIRVSMFSRIEPLLKLCFNFLSDVNLFRLRSGEIAAFLDLSDSLEPDYKAGLGTMKFRLY